MLNSQRYLVFAVIDFFLAAYIFYRAVLPVLLGNVGVNGFFVVGLLLMIGLIAMGIRFGRRAKVTWGEKQQ